MLFHWRIPVKQLALLVVAVLALTLFWGPGAAYAATSVTTTSNALRVGLTVLGLPVNVTLPATANWNGGTAVSSTLVNANIPNVATTGTVAATGGPSGDGGTAEGKVTGLNLLGGTLTADAVGATCLMNSTAISHTVNTANLRLSGLPVSIQADGTISLPGVLTAAIDSEAATWNTTSGQFVYTAKAIDLKLLAALGSVAGGTVVIGEAICRGNVKLGTVTSTGTTVAPGQSGTPTVTVSNTGDVAAPNTTIRIPKPSATYYPLGTPTVTGGGTCDKDGNATYIVCTGVTVPGGGTAKVSMPVTLKATATGTAPAWSPAANSITATSTPVAAATDATMTINGGGSALATALPRTTTGGTITVTPAALAAGKTAPATVKITNAGPSDADSATVTIPIGNAPSGVRVTSATSTSGTCVTDTSNVVCSNVAIGAGQDATITLNTAATLATPPGTTWDLANITTTLNNKTITGYGRVAAVSDPDVNIDNGVSITPVAGTPGGAKVNATVKINNVGIQPGTATVTFPAAPAGYTIDTAGASAGGGTCALVSGALKCTGVTVPKMTGGTPGSLTLTVPVTLGSGVTADWTGTVTATTTDSTGTATGTLINAVTRANLAAAARGPAARTVSPGQPTTMTVDIDNQGPSDAVATPFVVVAPQNTTFGPLTGAVGTACQTLTPTTVRCSVTQKPDDPILSLDLPLLVSATADASTPLAGGCVSLDNDAICGGAADTALPTITLRPKLADRLTVLGTPATITPGSSGTGTLTLTSIQAETGVKITVPKAALPSGFTVSAATVNGGTCDITGATAIVCTGIPLAANTPKDVQLTVQVPATATSTQTWTATGITVETGNESMTATGALATTGTPAYRLEATVGVPTAGSVEPGGTANVQVTVTNKGPSTATGASFTVAAPTGTTFGTLSSPASDICTANADRNLLTCTTTLALNAATAQLTLPLVVAANADPDKAISGSCVNLDGYPGCGAGDATIPPITLKVPAAAQVGFASDTVTVTPGDTATTAKLRVSATRAQLTNTVVAIPLTPRPAGLNAPTVTLAGGGACPVSANIATCTIPTIDPGTPQEINLGLTATAGAGTGTWTVPGITATIPAGTVTAADQTLARIGDPRNVVTATVNVPSTPILPGGTGSVSVDVNNTGPSDALGAKVSVIAPAGATFTALTPGSPTANACQLAADGKSAGCTFDQTVAASATTFTFPIAVAANVQAGADLTGGCVDLDANGICTTADGNFPPIPVDVPLQGRLTVSATPATVVPGDPTAKTATLTLKSGANINDLVVATSTAAPTGLQVTAVTAPGNLDCAPTATGTFNCGDVDLTGVNHSADITLTLKAAANADPATWTPVLAISGGGQNATAAAAVAVIGAAQPTLSATATVPSAGTLNPGDTATVNVTVANTGFSDAKNRVVTVTAPAGTTFDAANLPAACQSLVATRVQCTVTAPAGQNAALALPVVIPANADLFTSIGGGCVDYDGTPGCDASIPTITLRAPVDRRAAVSVTPVTVTPGTTGNASVRVTAENGDLTGFSIEVPLTLGAGLTIGSVTPAGPTCTVTGSTVNCSLGNLAKGASRDITIPVVAAANLAAGVTATAANIKIQDSTGPVTLTGTRPVAVTGAPQVTLTPTFGTVSAVEPGATGTIPVTLKNEGTSDATNARFSVVAPAGVTFGTPLPAGCTADATSTRLSCTATIAAGATAPAFSVPVTVDPTADPSGTITGGCFDRNDNGVCTSPPDVTLPAIPLTTRFDQEVTVRVNRAQLAPGTADTATAQVVITSTKAQNVDVSIPIPAAVSGWTISADNGCTKGASDITCTGLALPAGAKTVTLTITTPNTTSTGDLWDAGVKLTGRGAATTTTASQIALVGTSPYDLSVAVSGVPGNNSVLPGDTVPLTVQVTNSASSNLTSATIKAPVVITAPAGTTFGTPPADCTRTTPTTLNCRVDVSDVGTRANWTVPIVIPGNANPATPIAGGCVDLDSTPACDATIGSFSLRKPLATVVSTGTVTAASPAPGQTGTATVSLAAAEVRPNLGVTVSLAGLPAGVDVTAVRLGGRTCTIAAGTATCPGTNFPDTGTTPLAIDFTTGSSTAPDSTWRPTITVTDPGKDSVVLRPQVLAVGSPTSDVSVALVLPPAGTVLPGGTADVQVTMTNNSVSDDPAALATFTAPAGTTFDLTGTTAADYCTTSSATQISCRTALAAGAKAQFRLNLKVASTAASGASVAGGCVDVPGGTDCDTAIALTLGKPFSDQAQLGFTRATVAPGAIDSGFITVTTDRPLSGLTITVPLAGKPSDLEIAGASSPTGAPCTVNNTEITCSGISLASDGPDQRLVDVRLHPASRMPANATWSPTATLSNGAGGTSQANGELLRTSAPAPDVKYTMSAPTTPVAPGTTAVITGTLDNKGFSDLTNASVRVKAPTGTTFGTPLPAGCTAAAGSSLMDCVVNLPAGAAAPVSWSLPIQIPANANPNTPVTGGCVDFDRDNVCEPGEPVLPAVALTATLDQALTVRTPTGGGATLTPGVTGTVTVTVASTQSKSGLTVTIPTDTLPTGMQVVQVRSDAGSCTIGDKAVTCTNVSVTGGGTADVVLTTLVAGNAPAGDWSPAVLVSQGSQSKEQTVTAAATIGAPRTDPKLTVSVPVSGTVMPGGTGTLTLLVTNDGPSQATGLTYTVLAPTGTTFPTLTGPAASACQRVSDRQLNCTVNVAGNGRTSVAIPIAVDPTVSAANPVTGGCVRNTVGSTCSPSDYQIQSITLATPLSGKLQIAGAPVTVVPGRTGSGVLRITATGAVSNATVTIPLAGKPAGFTVTGVSGPQGSTCTNGATEIRCTGVNLVTGANTAVTVTTKVDAGAAGSLSWQATGITVAAAGETVTGGTAQLITSGDPVAAVTYKPTTPSRTVKPGETTSLTVAVSNAGPSDAARRTATLIAPNNTSFGNLSGPAATACTVTSASVLTCTYDLAAGASTSWTVPLQVSAGVKDGDKLTGGCVSADGNRTCGDDLDVSIDETPVNSSISDTGTLTLDGAVVPAGESGTALVRFSATAAFTGLTLTVPLGGLPTGFSVSAASIDGATCTVGESAITCTGIDLAAGEPKALSLSVDVAAGAAATAAWRATGITLSDPDDADDKLTASGLLVSTTAAAYSVAVTVGSPSVTAPAPGQTTVLPITLSNAGPGDADPYVATIRLPDGAVAGALPSGCVAGTDTRTVVCTVKLAAGASRTIQLPLVVSLDLKGGETLTGGCVDQALSTDPEADGECGGDTDVALPSIPVARHKVNLAVEYGKPAVTLTPGAAVVIRVPYTNDGTETADEVRFTVRPPAGVVVRSAAILLDAASAESISAAATANTVAAACQPAGGSEAANAVVCEAPDQAGLDGSELWLTIDASNSAKSGTQPMRVTVSTSSADGNSTDNTVEVMLKLKAKASSGNGGDDGDNGNGGGGNDGGGDLPRTGPQIFGALLTSLMLIIAGSLMLVTMRRPGAAAVAGRVPTSYPARHVRPAARPWTRRRRDDRQSG
ncbi:hypothetical protein OWR29_16365 [Actinoplanes sp. Pm04-4]|uniref:DUF11 domain-containing protein n=1 Tax=Paractinoplanes pyxinae TaxID=2997416 RepID=A0ABT4AZE5_9ACTN|nr:hypothetical protein [Actinoplanes pyxinae]MCY1139574.1 hypothetical protein [Actinoplanes pyxinae]